MRLTLLFFCLCLSGAGLAQKSNSKLEPYFYLLGQYDIKVFSPDKQGQWQPDGIGASSYTLLFDSTYIDELFTLNMASGSLTMRSTLGVDGRTNQFRLIAVDKEYSTMDVYEGSADGPSIVLSNLKSDKAFDTENGQQLSFRLTISPSDLCHHILLVEYTNDRGASWKPFSKQMYYKRQA